jgi:hypothetical protein
MKIRINGREWTRRLVEKLSNDGETDHDNRVIEIKRGQDERDELDTDIHEVLHASFPWMREWQVTRTANDLTALLFDKLKYRKK